MAKIVDVKKTFIIELGEKEGLALFKLIDSLSFSINLSHNQIMDICKQYVENLQDVRVKLRPYFDEIPF